MQIKKISTLLVCTILLSSCCGKHMHKQHGTTQNAEGVYEGMGASNIGADMELLNQRVYFALNSYRLSENDKHVLNKQVELIKSLAEHKRTHFVVEGHCDERGTQEYNIALGAQRAEAVKHYLVSQGVDAQKLSIISYGKEKPFVKGNNEAAWRQNRTTLIVPKEV